MSPVVVGSPVVVESSVVVGSLVVVVLPVSRLDGKIVNQKEKTVVHQKYFLQYF